MTADEIARIRAEALEEAARVAEDALSRYDPFRDELVYRTDVAEAIRALAAKGGD
jgi:hypothetical protein